MEIENYSRRTLLLLTMLVDIVGLIILGAIGYGIFLLLE